MTSLNIFTAIKITLCGAVYPEPYLLSRFPWKAY